MTWRIFEDMTDLHTRRVNIVGGETRFLRTDQGPTVVLLHTLRTQLEYFIPLMRALDQDLEIVARDLRGHGRSSRRMSSTPRDFSQTSSRSFSPLWISGACSSLVNRSAHRSALRSPHEEILGSPASSLAIRPTMDVAVAFGAAHRLGNLVFTAMNLAGDWIRGGSNGHKGNPSQNYGRRSTRSAQCAPKI
jgi:pimeloyl-ACP methyl ester carboxylesterase